MNWINVKQSLPRIGVKVLVANSEGLEIAQLSAVEEDGPQEMGHDAGFIGYFAFPARSFGNPEYFRPAQFQPTHWMPLPDYPDLEDERA